MVHSYTLENISIHMCAKTYKQTLGSFRIKYQPVTTGRYLMVKAVLAAWPCGTTQAQTSQAWWPGVTRWPGHAKRYIQYNHLMHMKG